MQLRWMDFQVTTQCISLGSLAFDSFKAMCINKPKELSSHFANLITQYLLDGRVGFYLTYSDKFQIQTPFVENVGQIR